MVECGFGVDLNDGSGMLVEHDGDDGAEEGVGGAEVEVEHARPGGFVLLPGGDAAGVSTDGIDEDVDAGETGEEVGDEGVCGGRVGDVGGETEEGTGFFFGGAFEGGELVGVSPGDDDIGSVVEKGESDGAAEAAGSSCDEDGFACEGEFHGVSLSVVYDKSMDARF